MKINAAIFDLDGTLIHTEIIKDVLFSFLTSCGFDESISRQIYKSARGKEGQTNFTLENLKKEIQQNIESENYQNIKFNDSDWDEMIGSFDNLQDSILVNGAKETISYLINKNIPIFILTLGSPEWQKKKIILSGLDKILFGAGETLDNTKKIICTSYEENEKGKIKEIDNILDSVLNFDGEGVIMFNDKPDETQKILNTFPKMRFFVRKEIRDIRYKDEDFEKLQKSDRVIKIFESLNFSDEIKNILEMPDKNDDGKNDPHVSSGAIVYKTEGDKVKVLLMYRQKSNTFHLPKGTQEKGESLENAALREIKEETGCDIYLKRKFISVDSAFKKQGNNVCKKTYYFIADYLGGDFSASDREHDEIFFAPYNEALIFLEKNGGHHIGFENEFEVMKNFGKYLGALKN